MASGTTFLAGSALSAPQTNLAASFRSLRLLGSQFRELIQLYLPSRVSRRGQVFLLSSAISLAILAWYAKRMAQNVAGKKDVPPPLTERIKSSRGPTGPQSHDAETSDPPLLQRHSEIKSFTTPRYTYPSIRVFYRRHQQADQLPTDPAPLPLLVFVHGLGGSAAQFHSLLTSLVHLASCLAVDLPGCGRSGFAPQDWDAYTTDALVELVEEIVESYREPNQGVVFIGHSMGCALAARLTDMKSAHHLGSSRLPKHTVGLVAICPPAEPPSREAVSGFRKLLWIPTPIFDLWRAWDRRGETESASVLRFVGKDADEESKILQYRFNFQSKTPVWRRMAWGLLPRYEGDVAKGGLPGLEVWSRLHVPVFLVAGQADHITKPEAIDKIAAAMGSSQTSDFAESEDEDERIPDAAAPVDTGAVTGGGQKSRSVEDITEDDFLKVKEPAADDQEYPSTPRDVSEGVPEPALPEQPSHPRQVVKTLLLPPPANHALLYMPSTARVLAGRVSEFLSACVTGRLSQSWQLQYLSKEGKWDVKNLEKWKKVNPVSKPIAGIFRAMKTLREVDEVHCPANFLKSWGAQVRDIVDISHDLPVYDPQGLERGGVRYHKFPTISKIPPTDKNVDDFVRLVDKLRREQKEGNAASASAAADGAAGVGVFIGVHCHYGFNRTGYFIACYLIERCGYGVQQAIDAFAEARPPGIRHQHFRDMLFVRYADLHDNEAH
ncbi:uncharacterized protein E0L32_005201 [Thyridium curvatum]|uniref:Tyrosine specific protein phosphatases domain-containing protein n=1 Tax=Thyridium curvatum TaxID=1093900 RepID=A0A507B6R5_9PEZI|nr:uncharacterized protein E0L32_005201 [Thyridium curvatum]TPX14806.1 hypothetical protein E0L32_005201 [Thyridium curvatum]